MNLKGWKYLLTFGDGLDIYAKGDRRVGIDRKTGEVAIEYVQKIPLPATPAGSARGNQGAVGCLSQ